ncbi:MAG: Uma2 family endonuclease [Anaerolineae bacterium]|nr:Uma2 family endonuclease [Gloeobacterales cyanobacterium ES-bin-313]
MEVQRQALTLDEFLALPEGEESLELIDGEGVPKVSPKYFHAVLQAALLVLLGGWCRGKGRVLPEWAVALKRQSADWVPVPDLTYISYERLPRTWCKNEACPVAPELVIEIISLGQTFGQLTAKAGDYLKAGVVQVWIVDAEARSVTIFYPDRSPETFDGNQPLDTPDLVDLVLTPSQIFDQARV